MVSRELKLINDQNNNIKCDYEFDGRSNAVEIAGWVNKEGFVNCESVLSNIKNATYLESGNKAVLNRQYIFLDKRCQ